MTFAHVTFAHVYNEILKWR